MYQSWHQVPGFGQEHVFLPPFLPPSLSSFLSFFPYSFLSFFSKHSLGVFLISFLKKKSWDFPGGAVVKSLHS